MRAWVFYNALDIVNIVCVNILGMIVKIVSIARIYLLPQEYYSSLEAVLPHTDVLYMTRIQRERFPSMEEYEKVCLHGVTI